MDRIEALLPLSRPSERGQLCPRESKGSNTRTRLSALLPLVLPCLLAALAQDLPAASYFVAKTGSDSNPGTSTLPFLTVQKGVNTAQAGDTVLVGTGTYAENVSSARSGNGSPIVVDGQGVATIWSFLNTHSNIHFRNFTLAGKPSGWWFWMGKGAHYCVLSNNIFDGQYNVNMDRMVRWDNPVPGSETPFGGNCASWCLVISNTFKRASGSAVVAAYGSNNVIYGNKFLDGDNVDWINPWGINNRFIGNFCSNLFISGLAPDNHPDLFQSFGGGPNGPGSVGMLIESNTFIKADGATQICMLESEDNPNMQNWTIRNNLFVGISSKGTMGFPNVHWYNNTFIRCSTNPTTAGSTLIFASNGNPAYVNFNLFAHGGKVFNNIFLDCGGPNADKGWYTFPTNYTNVAADFNYVGKNGYAAVVQDSLQRAVGDPGGRNYFAWWEPNGINGGNPLFANESQLDFRLQAGSPLIGAALPQNQFFTTDLRGTPRGLQWDIGPFEFQAGEIVTPPLPPTNLRVSAP